MNMTQQQAEQTISTIPTALAITLNTLERFSQRLSEDLTENREVNTVRTVESQLITIVVQNVALNSSGDNSGTKAEIVLPKKSSDDVQYSVMVKIPKNLAFNLSTDGISLAIATSITKRIEDKNSDSNDGNGTRQSTQGSDILTIALEGKFGIIELTENATLSFDVYSSKPSLSTCVFLDGTSWVSNGLGTDQKNQNITKCISPHFTSFAVFVTPHEIKKSPVESIALSVISYVFVGISFISLLISLIIFIVAGKPFFKVETNIVYFNYCLSMLFATGLFMFGIQVGTYNIVLCKIIAFLLHYSWLAVFTWTLCIGVLIMFKLVIGVLSTKKIYRYLIFFGWIFPVLIPIITIAVARDYYVDAGRHCFLNVKGGVIWAFIAPICTMILINTIFLIIAIIRIIQTRYAARSDDTQRIVKDALITGLVLTPVLGLPWLILIFNIAVQHSVLEWVFIIVNGLMGLVFLLVVVLRNKEVLEILKKKEKNNVPNVQKTPGHNMSSSAIMSSMVSSRFRKNTLERQYAKESQMKSGTIELKSVTDASDNVGEVDSDVKETFGHEKKVQNALENTAFTGATLGDVPIDKNLSSGEMASESPVFLQSPVSVLSETNEIDSNIADVTESGTQLPF